MARNVRKTVVNLWRRAIVAKYQFFAYLINNSFIDLVDLDQMAEHLKLCTIKFDTSIKHEAALNLFKEFERQGFVGGIANGWENRMIDCPKRWLRDFYDYVYNATGDFTLDMHAFKMKGLK